MGQIIKSRKHLFVRVPLILLSILIFAVSPILISVAGAQITEAITNEPCHEGNCFWGAFGWFFVFTMPVAGALFIIFMIIVISDVVKLARK